jgi:hypothetical protein
MKLINALILPAVFTKRTPKDQDPKKILQNFIEKLEKIEEEDPTDDVDFFKANVDYPTHDPADFEGDNLINLSENLSNPRNVLMRNPETGEENSDNKCGWNGCNSRYTHYYHVDYAIDGEPKRKTEDQARLDRAEKWYGIFFSYSGLRRNGAFVADIANNPTVGFVKVWPPINGNHDLSGYSNYNRMRVFVNDVECFAIDSYSNKWMKDNIRENPYDYQAAIFNCETPVKNAYTVRAHQANHWITFKGIEIYAPVEQKQVVEVPVNQAGSLSVLNQMNKKVALKNIVEHGCHCSKYSENEFVGGYAVDEMDKMCQQWNIKLKCLTLSEGACENGIDFEFFKIQVNNDGTPIEDLELACEANQSDCEIAVCKVTYDWGIKLWESVEAKGAGSKKYNYKPDSVCYPEPPKGDNHICVGEAPDVVIFKN